MKGVKYLLLAFSALAFSASPAFAADEPAKPGAAPSTSMPAGQEKGRDFAALDRDQDGSISAAEAAGDTNLKANFKKLDKDGDGKLSRTEFETGVAAGAPGK